MVKQANLNHIRVCNQEEMACTVAKRKLTRLDTNVNHQSMTSKDLLVKSKTRTIKISLICWLLMKMINFLVYTFNTVRCEVFWNMLNIEQYNQLTFLVVDSENKWHPSSGYHSSLDLFGVKYQTKLLSFVIIIFIYHLTRNFQAEIKLKK